MSPIHDQPVLLADEEREALGEANRALGNLRRVADESQAILGRAARSGRLYRNDGANLIRNARAIENWLTGASLNMQAVIHLED